MLWNCSLQDAHQGKGAYCGIDQACQRGQDEGDLIKKDTLLKQILCPVNFSSWGNLLNNALSKAVEKAMESDVEYRRGLPFNLSSFMGSGVVGRLFVQVLKITNYLSFLPFLFNHCWGSKSQNKESLFKCIFK